MKENSRSSCAHLQRMEDRSLPTEREELVLWTWIDMATESLWRGNNNSPWSKLVGCSTCVMSRAVLKIRPIVRRRSVPTLLYWAQKGWEQPLREATVHTILKRKHKHGFCADVSLTWKSLDLKYHSLALRAAGSLQGLYTKVVSTTRLWCSGTGISDFFFFFSPRHEVQVPPKSWWSRDMFSSLMFFSYYRAQNWKTKNKKKQVIETIKYDQHWIFNLASSDVSVKAFLYFNLFKAGVGDVWPCIVTRRGLFFCCFVFCPCFDLLECFVSIS